MDVFILALFAHTDKLRPSTLYQLLTGKRTSSVLSYGCFYDRLGLFQALPDLTEEAFQQQIDQMLRQGALVADPTGLIQTVDQAEDTRAGYTDILAAASFYRYGRTWQSVWRLLRLLIQAASYQGVTNRYIPVENTPMYTEPVRQILRQVPNAKDKLFQELWQIFEQMPAEKADFLAGTLTGPHVLGKTFFQLVPEDYQEKPWQHLYTAAAIQHFIALVEAQQESVLYRSIAPFLQQNANQSMLETQRLFQEGLSVKEIMHQRNLKEGTVNDHLIEWALLDQNFPYARFDRQIYRLLPASSWQYRYQDLQQLLGADFLPIRLFQIAQKRGIIC
ncbi:helix-turn-helix domain-containing protein [Enterococcus sp. RIT-PI-f]|uniref:helix-turn-helix domain-containing protein n=1 Tax=Enterococcus sp. RIT-PI-f TaxID=1690244 RepID=UPI0006B8A793|nr:helix-turn-helix domain-containing protein [Enterococcus sp. RIT-PI-f]KPG69318.1 hypothetical protein AEQ18_11405 [Enterococcus sp. RIT-PI-f]